MKIYVITNIIKKNWFLISLASLLKFIFLLLSLLFFIGKFAFSSQEQPVGSCSCQSAVPSQIASAACCLFPTSNFLLLTYFLLLTTYFILPTSYYLLLTTYFLLPTSNYLLLTTYFQLPTSYFYLFRHPEPLRGC
jgi:hypothetical protein